MCRAIYGKKDSFGNITGGKRREIVVNFCFLRVFKTNQCKLGILGMARGDTRNPYPKAVQVHTHRFAQGIHGELGSRVYIAQEVKSHFKKGKFTQSLKGKLRIYYTPKELADQGRTPVVANTTVRQVKTPAPQWKPTDQRSSVTNPTPTSSLAKGTQQILTLAVQADNPSLSQLQASPVYIQARRGGATPQAALDAARASFAAGTNNAANFAAPGIRTGPQKIVKDQ